MFKSWQFGTRADGHPITAFELVSESGFRAVILDQGAILQSFQLPDGRNVTLGFDDWDEYETDETYMGRIIGPNSNRIVNAEFQTDGLTTRLTKNDGPNNLHSGPNGFDVQSWTAKQTQTGLTLALSSPDCYHGFPGAIEALLDISLSQNRLRLDMKATSSRATPMNLTWHPYWNLSGSERIDGHNLHLDANSHTIPDATEAVPVKDTRFDFRKSLPLGSFRLDTNYQNVKETRLISGRTAMTVKSSLPDMQVYSGDALPHPRKGIALEPQFRPNDINAEQDSLLRPGADYHHWIEYSFELN